MAAQGFKILEISTVQTSAIKTLVEALKELLTDTVVEFDKDGIKIITTDNAHVILVHMRLHESKFEIYKLDPRWAKLSVGINMMNLHKIIKAANSGDTLSIVMYESDMSRLHITFENSEKNSKTTYALNLLDMDPIDITIPPEKFPVVITLPSTDFQKICRDMHNIADQVEIKSVGNQLILSSVGDFCSQETVLCDVTKESSQSIVQGIFNLKYLTHFTKCTNLCNTTEIYLKNDYPLIVRYQVASLGEIKLCLAPQDDK
jgi:proliferating cell nuclear antigen